MPKAMPEEFRRRAVELTRQEGASVPQIGRAISWADPTKAAREPRPTPSPCTGGAAVRMAARPLTSRRDPVV